MNDDDEIHIERIPPQVRDWTKREVILFSNGLMVMDQMTRAECLERFPSVKLPD